MQITKPFDPPPRLPELGFDLLVITSAQRMLTVTLPFICAGIY
ncbi:MAG: hypothetical protein JWR69_324, partial [Pedosphaera sp.]|nr:hypothetical protein [Pedosphaera sp.]